MFSDSPLPGSVQTRPFLHLTLIPLQLPETSLVAEQGAWTRGRRQQQRSSGRQPIGRPGVYEDHPELIPHLRICPGTPSQILVQVRNQSSQRWEFRVGISADIPADWYDLPNITPELPGQTTPEIEEDVIGEVEIPFLVPVDFFENHHALKPDNQPLTIDYDGQVQVYARPMGAPIASERLLATAPFRVMVRSPSRYLDYLPQVYRDVDFIGRLLKLFEQSFDPSVEMLQLLWAYLDPRTAPQHLLPFLAHWVGWPTDFPWQNAPFDQLQRQRQLIFHAMDLYRWRGTSQGLRHYLHLYTGLPPTCIRIDNAFQSGFELGTAHLDQTAIIGRGRPYHFVVHLEPHPPDVSATDLQANATLIRAIIDQEKPAFCTYDLHFRIPQ
ncbi:MAG: phage tail protein [Cyanobacteria bacterium P01_F01_bin.56]